MLRKVRIHHIELSDDDYESDESLNVPTMRALLRQIRDNMLVDEALSDLAPQLSTVITELDERRRLAVEIANEDSLADMTIFPLTKTIY